MSPAPDGIRVYEKVHRTSADFLQIAVQWTFSVHVENRYNVSRVQEWRSKRCQQLSRFLILVPYIQILRASDNRITHISYRIKKEFISGDQ